MRYFKAVADCGNMTKAAEKLHVSQPALSKAIKSLEKEMGTPLFDRVGRSIVLNEDGRVVHRAVNNAIDSVDAVPLALNAFARRREHVVNLYTPVPLGDDVNLFSSFRKERPDITLRIALTRTQDFEDDSADLTFFASPTVHNEPNYLLLGTEPLVVSLPKGHPLEDRDEIELVELRDEALVTVAPCRVRTAIDGLFEKAGFKPEIAIEDQVCLQVNSLVGRGMGYAVTPLVTWFSAEDYDKVSVVRIRGCNLKRNIYLKWQENTVLSEPSRALAGFLKNHYSEACAICGD